MIQVEEINLKTLLRNQLEEMAISLRSGNQKGQHVTGIFDIPELVEFILERDRIFAKIPWGEEK